MPTTTPQRPLLRDQAYDQLKSLIVTGTFPPGSFLSERKLGDRLGMSKTPIKAALALLESEGFVTVSPQQGIVVREITAREVVDLFDVRIALESFICHRLAGSLTIKQETDLLTNISKQQTALENEDRNRFNRLDARLHLLMAGMAENAEILGTIRRTHDRVFQMALRVIQRSDQRFQESFDEHSQIVDALIDGNGKKAARVMEKHIERGKQFLLTHG